MSDSNIDRRPVASSRRAVLAAAAGGIGAWLAGALGRATPAAAANGDTVHVGDNLSGTATTKITVATASFSALGGNSTGGGSGVGVRGDSASSDAAAAGVLGIGASNGVVGKGNDGVRGDGTSIGVVGKGNYGVRGDGTSIGVVGFSDAIGVGGRSKTAPGVQGFSESGPGVEGTSFSGPGVSGYNGVGDAAAVRGEHVKDGPGVAGYSFSTSIAHTFGPRPKTGVYGEALQDSSSRGVWGRSTTGQGLRGEATSGVAVFGTASSIGGYAFRGSGRVRFDKVSGVATIAANATSVTITPGVDLNADSFVLLTPKANIGTRSLYFSTDATNNKFTIRISSSRTSSTPVAWLLLR